MRRCSSSRDTHGGARRRSAAPRARAARRAIVAVTGSVGKTGTKEALRRALRAPSAPTFASAGSLNNHWGVPLSLARMPRDTGYGVFEMGMNHPGEIDALSRMVRPHVAVITTVEPAHLGFFASVEAIADAKAEIFLGIEPGGAAVLNRDNAHFARLAAAARARGITRILGFGSHADADGQAHRLRPLRHRQRGRPRRSCGEIVDYRIAIPGRHWVHEQPRRARPRSRAAGGDVERRGRRWRPRCAARRPRPRAIASPSPAAPSS